MLHNKRNQPKLGMTQTLRVRGKKSMNPREIDFQKIKQALGNTVSASNQRSLLAAGDSLALLKLLPDHSVSLILTDPPYHSTKKKNIHGDTHFEEDQHYLEWMQGFPLSCSPRPVCT